MARLIKKSMKGDATAFAQLYHIFVKTIYYNVNAELVDKSDTEDAVQQVVIALHRGLPNLQSPYAFHSFLYRITVNVCKKINMEKAKLRQRTLDEAEEELTKDRITAPPQELERKDRNELVREFISKLPEKQRYTLLLYYYYDMPYKDIANAMDTSVTVVGSNINRSKKNLRQMLEDHEKEVRKIEGADESFQGVSMDAILTGGVTSVLEHEFDPAAADVLWHNCLERFPEITAASVAYASNMAAVAKTVVGGIIASLLVIGIGVAAFSTIHYESSEQPTQNKQKVTVVETQFIPDSVSINMPSSNPEYPETYNPLMAELVLSEGRAIEWTIVDAEDTAVAQGTTPVIDRTVFAALQPGEYEVQWAIANEEGDRGIASRQFTILEETSEAALNPAS